MLYNPIKTLSAVGILALGLTLISCAMQPDPKYAPDKYFDQPYRSAAAAIWQGDLYLLKKTFKNRNLEIDHIGKENHSLLLYSLSCKNYRAVEFLLKQGADPNLVNPDSVQIGGETVPYPIQPVAYAANDEDPTGLKALLEAGGNPDSKHAGAPAIHQAEEAGKIDNIELLLEHGANIEGRDGTGVTPLLNAAYMSDWDMVNFFIKRGANWKAYDVMGVTLAKLVQDNIELDIGTNEYRRKLQKLKGFLESKGVGFPVEKVEVSEAEKKKLRKGLPPNARVDPETGEPLDSASTTKGNNKKGSGPDIFVDEQ